MRSVRSCCGAAPTSTSSPDDVWRGAVWPWAGFALSHPAPQLVLPSPPWPGAVSPRGGAGRDCIGTRRLANTRSEVHPSSACSNRRLRSPSGPCSVSARAPTKDQLTLKRQIGRRPGTAGEYSNLTVQHRPHTTDTGSRPAPTTSIDLCATRPHRGGHQAMCAGYPRSC